MAIHVSVNLIYGVNVCKYMVWMYAMGSYIGYSSTHACIQGVYKSVHATQVAPHNSHEANRGKDFNI